MKLGIASEEIETVSEEYSDHWAPDTRALMLAADDLIENRNISTGAWEELIKYLSEDQIVEFCMLVGHYFMVALTINTLGINIEPQFDLK